MSNTQTLRAAFFCDNIDNIAYVYGAERRAQLAQDYTVYPHIITDANFDEHRAALADIDIIFSTWGMWLLSPEQLSVCAKCRIIFYAAGTVKHFAQPMLERGITVVSSWAANAVPVAEYTVAQIILASKEYFRIAQECTTSTGRAQADTSATRGLYGMRVSLIGGGMIGCLVARMLQVFHVEVCIVDPYKSEEDIVALGAKKIDLAEAFATSSIVSNHLPNIPATVGMLQQQHFASLPQGAHFINTGRGAQVDEAGLIAALQQRPDIYVLLDVTNPEPPVADSPLYTLNNVVLTPHIAGSQGDEVRRMADYAIEECARWAAQEPLRYAVTEKMLETMA